MLRSLKELEHYKVTASDGDVGKVKNFLLDDEHWLIRYLVVDTGGLLERHEVLISPVSFSEVEWATQRFHVSLTMEKVKHSPSVDTDKPVSRQQEEAFHNYYGYPLYWDYPAMWGAGSAAALLATEELNALGATAPSREEPSGDIHLRSAKELRGYDIQATDGSIGHVDDFIVDDQMWEVRYLVIDTSNWWFGKKVLVAPEWASDISWEDRKVEIVMSRDAIKDSPEWDPSVAVNREYETRLYDYYRKPGYWEVNQRRRLRPSQHSDSGV
jgi:sporulation protein YlmC with PRC-barrel domain